MNLIEHLTRGEEAVEALIAAHEKIGTTRKISITIHMPPQDIFSLACGKKISNNYFKMHGGIMRRKVERKRKK